MMDTNFKNWESAGNATPQELETQIQMMLMISSHFLSEFEMATIVRPNQNECFAIYFMGRILGKFNNSAVVRDPLHPRTIYRLIMSRLSNEILNKEAQRLIKECPQTTQRLFALGIHVSNVENNRVSSEIIKFDDTTINRSSSQA